MNQSNNNNKVKIILRKSVIGSSKNQRLCIKGLGLTNKINNYSLVEDTNATRGLMRKVMHLIEIKN